MLFALCRVDDVFEGGWNRGTYQTIYLGRSNRKNVARRVVYLRNRTALLCFACVSAWARRPADFVFERSERVG
jgi:hypothetical protein